MALVRSRNPKRTASAPHRDVTGTDFVWMAILSRFRETGECPEDWPDDWKQDGIPLVRRESTIYRLSSVRSGRSICVKVIKSESRGLKDSASLYAALSHYHARSDREQGYTVPEPYGWVPEHAAVIMEWVEGRTVSEMLKRDLFSTRRRHENIRKVAGWLRWFHSQSEPERGNLTNGWQLKTIVKVFNEAGDLDKAATAHDPVIREYIGVASRSAGLLRGVEIDSAILHGDFKATNLIISNSGVVGIDFLGRRRGPVSNDIFRFLSDLDFYRGLLGRSFAMRPASASNDFEVFLAAYGGRAAGIARPSFVYLYFLTILSAIVHQRRKFKRGAEHMIRLAVVRGIARQLSHELSGGARRAFGKPGRVPWLSRPRIPALRIPSLQIPVDWGLALWESDVIWSFM